MSNVLLSMYAIKNSEGKYFRAKGYGGYGASWVDDLKNAKIYAKIGPARSRVTFLAKNYNLPRPVIVELQVNNMVEIDETERINKSIANEQKRELARKQRMLHDNVVRKQNEIDRLKEEIQTLKRSLEK